MSEFVLHRYEDPSNVSGTGAVAWGVEWPDGAVAVRWPGEHPSTAAWSDIRGVEAIHGHSGKTLVEYTEPKRLLAAYQQVTFWLLTAGEDSRPMSVGPHPDWPDRLLVRFRDESTWMFWVALMDGSTYAATHKEHRGQLVTTWATPDGNVWLQWTRDGSFEALLDGETYDPLPEPTSKYPDNSPYDDRD